MTLSDISIKRPVFATVLSALILVVGLASLLRLPVRELPDVDSARVTVSVGYEGAAPEIIDTEIVELIEGAVSGIEGIRTITSRSRLGSARTVIEFESSRSIDEAANDVRDSVGRVTEDLPEDAEEPRIVKADSDADPVMRVSITSDRLIPAEISDYTDRFIVDRLSTLDGVAQVEISGERRFAIRIWLDRQALAARNLAVEDVEAALRRNNVELPAGELKSEMRQFTVRTDTRLRRVEDFQNIVVDRVAGYPIRLAEVARVELGVEDDDSIVRADGRAAVGLRVIRQAQANTIAVSQQVREQIDLIRPTLPDGMTITVSSDDAIFIEQSIWEVVKALGISVALVVLVIFLFLYSPSATLVPAVTIPVAVIGTFALIHAFGFSINVLTLLALLLAIGLVVDDAIVVLENVQRRVETGEKPLVAAFLGTRQVTFAVVATSLTLIAVFVPISFLQGSVGRLFTEFGFVLASAVAISTLVALTLCPMLCSKLLRSAGRPGPIAGPITRGLETGLRTLGNGYRNLLDQTLRMPLVVLFLAVVFSAASVWFYTTLPKELTPTEDRGVFFIPITAPQGATIAYTDESVREIEAMAMDLRDSGEARRVFALVGRRDQANEAFVVVGLTDWSTRERSQEEIIRALVPEVTAVPGVRAFPVSPSGLGQGGSSQPLRIVIGGPNYESIQTWADAIVRRARQNPKLENIETDFEATQPQFNVLIDRRRADDLGVEIEQIGRTLQTMLASREVTDYIDRGREYPVILQAQEDDRGTPTDLANIFIRSGSTGQLVPLTTLVTLEEVASAPELRRYDRLPSITISAALGEGYDLGSAIDFMREIAAEELPVEARLGFAGQSRHYLETSGGVLMTFALALVIVFLVLAAQFESFVHPLIIMLGVPLALTGGLASLWLTGNSLNVYSQIGAVLLIGLVAKNGILIVEFANQLRSQGLSIREAILEGSALRFRPILMTVVSTILGALPLVLATGAGAESRMAIGVVVIGGLGFASILTLFVTPVLYHLLAHLTRPVNAIETELTASLAERQRQPAE
ncbi:efflux RND transporter permease subunit [Rhodospirillaceae bacterium SYSU D60014]|uniref:efflux RND transporter permease subunit n=1 Tax=Virgifigura deserti TaxID=2268457 RepID=UPI000E65F7F7